MGLSMNTDRNIVLITGGSKGIGFEMAKQLLKMNNKVIITGRDEEMLQMAAKQLGDVTTIQSDVSKPDDVEALYQRVAMEFPNLNLLINNAGAMQAVNLQMNSHSMERLTMEIDVNLKGTIWTNNVFLPLLKKKPNAAIVNISSGLAFVPSPVVPVYCATKAAIHSYSLSLRAQLSNTNIQVFELAPPLTETGMIGAFAREDLQGIKIMSVSKLVAELVKGLSRNRNEIRPGLANQLYLMSRFLPKLMLKVMSRSVKRMQFD